ncbi:branched-chain amino acid ABC transporter permease [Halococcus saccharolyticus]|uniref:Branched-chain amino acid ABC transporter permease n=1 Tax=Halococcus saccharolyticus DSM 5350 TaxID=1227455 RepID=M0MIC5_9EURY|nr:branched-chain amino acid ABC transporter permease [Halococcus saccharolyticus]EMA44195.1 branched-chain amino acid ABC transporter permease [Halococcus saccharolyticus DSM 5350]
MSLVAETARILLNGLQTGAIYVLLAIGLSIILGTLKFVNFAHGALYVVGLYVGLLVSQETTFSQGQLAELGFGTLGLDMGFLAALIIVPIIVFVLGMAMERFVARPFYDRPDTDQILLTFGLAIVVQQALRVLFGGNSQSFAQPEWASGAVQLPLVGGFPQWRLWVIVITAVLVVLVYALIEFTDFGLTVRAGTQDSEMVQLLGIKITRPYIAVFGIGAALAGVAGVVGGPLNVVNPTVGTDILVPAFLTVVIGGLGSIRGAVLGGLILGITQSFLIQWSLVIPALGINYAFAPWSQVGIYAIAAVILLVRPQGLLGSEVDIS